MAIEEQDVERIMDIIDRKTQKQQKEGSGLDPLQSSSGGGSYSEAPL